MPPVLIFQEEVIKVIPWKYIVIDFLNTSNHSVIRLAVKLYGIILIRDGVA